VQEKYTAECMAANWRRYLLEIFGRVSSSRMAEARG
jgi:hypothetical protein